MSTAVQNPYDLKEKSTGEESYSLWLSRLELTRQWRHNYEFGDKAWSQAYRIYSGKHWNYGDDVDDVYASSDYVKDRITVNIAGSTILNIVPFLVARDPVFMFKPRKSEDVVAAMLQENLLNYEFRKQKMLQEVKRSVTDCAITGTGIIKTGYTLEVDEGNKSDGELVYEDYVKVDRPFVQRINPFDFLFDPTGETYDLRSARWCAQIFYKPYRDVIANKRYNKSVRDKINTKEYSVVTRDSYLKGIQMADLPSYSDGTFSWEEAQLESSLVVLYEVWDKKFKKYYVFAANVADPLIEKDWPYDYLDGFPFLKLDYIPIPNSPYGIGIPYWIRDQQYELNRNRTAMFEHRRRFNRKYAVLENAMDESEMIKLQEGEDGTIVQVRGGADSIQAIEDAPMSQDIQVVEQIIKADIQELTGSDALLRGGGLPSRTTGTEVQTRAQIFRMKLDDRVDAVDQFVTEIGRQIVDHIKANMIKNEVIKIVGQQGEYWVEYTSEDIQAEADVEIETVSKQKLDPVVEKQQALQVFQLASQMLPLVQSGQISIDFNQLFKWLLEKFDIKDASRFFAPSQFISPPLTTQLEQPAQQAGNPNPEIGMQPQQPEMPMAGEPTGMGVGQEMGLGAIMNQGGLQGSGGL